LTVWVGEDVYLELVRRYGVRGLSKGVDNLLRETLFGAGNALTVKATSGLSEKPIVEESEKTTSGVNEKAITVQPPSPPAPVEQKVEAPSEAEAPPAAPAKGGPTPRQLALIESLLRQLGDDWGTVREVLLLDKGVEAPEDYGQLSGETLDRVIKTLKEWAKHPAAGEIKDARLRAQKLFEQGVNVGLPESARDVLRYHLVKLELAEAGALKPRK